MMNITSSVKNEPKYKITYGLMGHLDPKQPPTKRKPFATILNHGFVHRVELILPEELFQTVSKKILQEDVIPTYSEVILPLSALLQGQFFNEYIKKGNVLMLSEGKVGVDNVYSLREGVLTLHLDRESYERAGLTGKPDGAKGNRKSKPWWVVEINLRLPSMLHGKRGFDRVLYAFKNVLTAPVTWLFHDLGTSALSPDPLDLHFPTRKALAVQICRDINVNMPSIEPPTDLQSAHSPELGEYAAETYEWLSSILLESSSPLDDPYISRYKPLGESTEQRLIKITWEGLSSVSWAYGRFVCVLLAMPRDAWFAYSVSDFREGWQENGKSSMVMKLPDDSTRYMLWEIA